MCCLNPDLCKSGKLRTTWRRENEKRWCERRWAAHQHAPWTAIQFWDLGGETGQGTQGTQDGVQQHRQAARHGHHALWGTKEGDMRLVSSQCFYSNITAARKNLEQMEDPRLDIKHVSYAVLPSNLTKISPDKLACPSRISSGLF